MTRKPVPINAPSLHRGQLRGSTSRIFFKVLLTLSFAAFLVRFLTAPTTNRYWTEILTSAIWIWAILRLFGLVEPLNSLQESISFTIGEVYVSMLTIQSCAIQKSVKSDFLSPHLITPLKGEMGMQKTKMLHITNAGGQWSAGTRMMKRLALSSLLFFTLGAAMPCSAAAEETPQKEGWQFGADLYLWMPIPVVSGDAASGIELAARILYRKDCLQKRWQVGKLFPRVGFIVTKSSIEEHAIAIYYNGWTEIENRIKEGKNSLWGKKPTTKMKANWL